LITGKEEPMTKVLNAGRRRMVSARAWPDHPEWMREFMSLLAECAPAEGAEQAVTA